LGEPIGGGLDRLDGDVPRPEFAAMVAEQCGQLLGALNSSLRPVALYKLEGFTHEEISRRLDCSVSTVERSLRLIRKIWQPLLGGADARSGDQN